MALERNEYPRPQFARDSWITLNGKWDFSFDNQTFDKTITVPFSYQYLASGINEQSIHKTLWYKRGFSITEEQSKQHSLLCFNGCNSETDVWVNGIHAIKHEGSFAPFYADVTEYVKQGNNEIVVRCIDPYDSALPRGKQTWKSSGFSCWYVPNGGIWQSVWIEFFGDDCIAKSHITPNLDTFSFEGEIETLYGTADEVEVTVSFEGEVLSKQRFLLSGKYTKYTVWLTEHEIHEELYWTLDKPRLINVDYSLFADGKEVDVTHTRFGMRKISIDCNGKICLNNKPLYQKLVLDQGYWKDSGLTPPSAEALKKDIMAAKNMGFNGARKHQKLEDPYWYYYADELGFLTWCEMPSAYNFQKAEIAAITKEWQEIVGVAMDFTSVIAYVPLNESWGVKKIFDDTKQQDFARSLYYLTKSIDDSRLVSTNDGWENISETDIISIHDYASDGNNFQAKYSEDTYDVIYPQGKKLMANSNYYSGQPVIFSEFGGIAKSIENDDEKWGYGENVKDSETFYKRLKNLVENICNCDFQGYCYTQLSDVQQEINGLLDENHIPKYDFAKIKEILDASLTKIQNSGINKSIN